MSRLGAPITIEHIDSFFKIGKDPKLDTVPRSTLGGRNLDPKTGKAAIVDEKHFIPSYKRNARRNNPNQLAYARHYQELEEQALRSGQTKEDDIDDDGLSTTTGGMERLEVISMTTGLTSAREMILPEGLTEDEANQVYINYNFRREYDESLAIYKMRQDIIETIASNEVTVIQGETGSGKTTQVPQYILDHYAQVNKYCNIIVTQPRRIAAISISRRVCHERNWQLGYVCGYQVGMDKQCSEDTRLLYVTTGVLLQKLINNKHMSNYTHVILDEVHERDQETDLALLIVRNMLRKVSRDVKVVLMSATFESNRFAEYFAISIRGELHCAPVLDIKGRSFTVQEYYLDSLKPLGELPEVDDSDPRIDPRMFEIVRLLLLQFDNMEMQGQGSSQLHPNGLPAKRGSVLIFLPGLSEINDMDEKLREISTHSCLRLLPLHSTITTEEQARVFEKPTPGFRKIIMSTNIAESSITVPDIKYVVDFCLTKNLMCDPETGYTSLQLQWASQANCIQRQGRAGRVSNGRVYRLVYRNFYKMLERFGSPEMQRCPLDIVILKVKRLDIGEPKSILGLALDPPSLDDIECTILLLKEVGALTTLGSGDVNPHDGNLTFLGRVVAELPLDIHLGKMILLGHVFGLLEECIIISASLSMKSFFSTPYKAHMEAYRKKFDWANDSFSDCLAYLLGYKTWKHMTDTGCFPSLKDEMRWARDNFIQLRRIKDVEKMVGELRNRLIRFNIVTPSGPNRRPQDIHTEENQLILKVILAGAFYPNYFNIGRIDEEQATRQLGGHNPSSTVMVCGLPANQGSLYRKNVEDIFTKCDSRGKKPRVHFEETRAYVEFHRDPSSHSATKILPAVYMALKMKQIGQKGSNKTMEFPELDPEMARQQMDELSLRQDSQSTSQNVLRSNRISTAEEGVMEDAAGSSMLCQVELPPPNLTTVELAPTLVTNCGAFWAHYGDQDTATKLSELQTNINLYSGKNLQNLAPQSRQVGTLCLALYTDVGDGISQYYRACIERLYNSKQIAVVFFVDYGNVEEVSYHTLRQLESHLTGLRFQAIEFQLAEIKPSSIKCPNGHWTKEAKEVFKKNIMLATRCLAKVYSVVHGIVRVVIFLYNNQGVKTNFNDKLVTLCYADRAEEDFASKLNHRQREEGIRTAVSPPTRAITNTIPQANRELSNSSTSKTSFVRRRGEKIHLLGPIHPYEINFYNMTAVGRLRTCKTDLNSVNCVALDNEPYVQHSRMMVAAHVGLNSGGNVMQARDTTLMPSIPGLPALMTMLFTPMLELRVSADKKRYTGVLCGLGWDSESNGPVLGDHDIEITFDTDFNTEDLGMVNSVRIAINLAIGGEDAVADWGPDAIASIQANVRTKFIALFQHNDERREPVEPTYCKRPYHWNQFDPEDVLRPEVDFMGPDSTNTLYQLHNAIALARDEDEEEDNEDETQRMQNLNDNRKHIQWLHTQATKSMQSRTITCELCNIMVQSPRDLLIHLQTNVHKTNEQAVMAQLLLWN